MNVVLGLRPLLLGLRPLFVRADEGKTYDLIAGGGVKGLVFG